MICIPHSADKIQSIHRDCQGLFITTWTIAGHSGVSSGNQSQAGLQACKMGHNHRASMQQTEMVRICLKNKEDWQEMTVNKL